MVEPKAKAGFEYLLAYKITVPIYDLTVEFCELYISKFSRTVDQMVQAARSGMANIVEGNKQQSLSGYIRLAGVARGSLEELLRDYLAFARQKKLEVYGRERAQREIGEIRETWRIVRSNSTLPDQPHFPDLPKDPEKAVNLMITLVSQANFLQDKLIASLKEKHTKEGGFSEKLLLKRLAYRKEEAWKKKT